MNTKIIPVVFLIVILGVGVIAFNFYTEKQKISEENYKLKEEQAVLIEENNDLKIRYNSLRSEKSDLDQQFETAQVNLSSIQKERDTWKKKYSNLFKERDQLLEKIKDLSSSSKTSASSDMTGMIDTFDTFDTGSAGVGNEDWADFIRKKAMLEAKLEELNKSLLDTQYQAAELKTKNKELSINIDQLLKEKERLTSTIRLKERALRVMSVDLVSERGERKFAVEEAKKLRVQNGAMKKDIILTGKEKVDLEKRLKNAINKKIDIEDRIIRAEALLKEKSFVFDDLKKDLESAIKEGKRILESKPEGMSTAIKSVPVELPPIVVQSAATSFQAVADVFAADETRGEIIAVNKEENFVVIDIGDDSGLKVGSILDVMRGESKLATIEIIETREEIAAADIKELKQNFSLREGDIVILK